MGRPGARLQLDQTAQDLATTADNEGMTKTLIAVAASSIAISCAPVAQAHQEREDPYGKGLKNHSAKVLNAHKRALHKPAAVASRSSWS